jgi:IMP and pyridine-specific 5'-nucleotidase
MALSCVYIPVHSSGAVVANHGRGYGSLAIMMAPKGRNASGRRGIGRGRRVRCEAGSGADAGATLTMADRVAGEERAWVGRDEPKGVVASNSLSEERVVLVEDALSAAQMKQADASTGGMRWNMLLSTEALEDAHLFRASSVTDAHVLRRKGRLKEQDGLIEFIISMHGTHSPFQVMEKVERWVREHVADASRSTLTRLIPHLGARFHTPLPLVRALAEYDEFASLSRRKFVPPNFAEVRHVLNIAQVHAVAEKLQLITFDADGTIYADGHHIRGDNKMIAHIVKLMRQGIHVAIVTAAGYPGNAAKFEGRLAGLLEAFESLQLPHHVTRLFHVMGGECNYLLRVNSSYKLEFVPDELWKSADMLAWGEHEVTKLLDDAERSLRSAAARLRVPVEIIRKPRAVGAVPRDPTIYEVLEEMALTVQVQLMHSPLPFCAFNGGNDVFVDVGNKSVGLRALMQFLSKKCCETLHVGDRFTMSGNDAATRSQCSILWVANPEETAFFTRLLLRDIRLAKLNQYIE